MLNNGIAELFWAGIVTNDVFTELQGVKRLARGDEDVPYERIEIVEPRHNPQRAKLMQSVRKAIRQVPGWAGRWSLLRLPGVMGEPISVQEQAAGQALLLLQRYGILAKEFVQREELLSWPLIAGELQMMEMRGEIRRGYFVEGYSGMQYALPAAVEELRRSRTGGDTSSPVVLVNACDPANPYGPGIGLPTLPPNTTGFRLARLPGNYLAFHGGTPALVIENYGSRIWTPGEPEEHAIQEGLRQFLAMTRMPSQIRPFKDVLIEYCNGDRPAQSPLASLLAGLGFWRDRNQTMRFDGY